MMVTDNETVRIPWSCAPALMFPTIRALLLAAAVCFLISAVAAARDLDAVKHSGVLRHLGIPYANFVTGSGDGMDVEIARAFARHLGVRYEFVRTSWPKTFGDLTGRTLRFGNDGLEYLDETPIRGDLIGHGLTVLDWRKRVVDYSDPVFPTAVWLVARADAAMSPIAGTADILRDIASTKSTLEEHSVLGAAGSCADPKLYSIAETGAEIRLADGLKNPFDLIPRILQGRAESTLLDAPDVMLALERYPGEIKVIGPVSPPQHMAFAFRKDSPRLRESFDRFLRGLKADGTYLRLVEEYYPSAGFYFPAFFAGMGTGVQAGE